MARLAAAGASLVLLIGCDEENCYDLQADTPYEVELMNYEGGDGIRLQCIRDNIAIEGGVIVGDGFDLATQDIVGFTIKDFSSSFLAQPGVQGVIA